MAIPVIMPKQGQSVETCIITKWYKKAGDAVKAGDILYSYETDKAAFDFESPADGTILEIFYGEGDEVPVLNNVAVIGSAGDSADLFRPSLQGGASTKEALAATSVPGDQPDPVVSAAPIPVDESDTRTRISPRAKRLAMERGLDYAGMEGSGPGGRIIFRDVENALTARPVKSAGLHEPAAGFIDQPLSNVRKLIAKAMHSSLQNSAQLTHHMGADARKLLGARRKIREDMSHNRESQDITLNDMICWCVVRALQKFPDANSHFLDDRIRNFHDVHLGIAVDTPRGLMVPSVRNAGILTLPELSASLKSVAEACRKGNIDPELLQSSNASFTVTNLGGYGVEMFTPVLNLPQVAILGVCTITYRPADLGNNVFGFVPYMGLSLTYDHRAIDGGPATLFLKEVRKEIEEFGA
ncbi:MAG: dihydrolipoamide acetyltransferase family protein [Bacteroidales bacterium]